MVNGISFYISVQLILRLYFNGNVEPDNNANLVIMQTANIQNLIVTNLYMLALSKHKKIHRSTCFK